MKKNFTKAVLLALAVTSMGTFNSCKDHDDCGIDRIELEILKTRMQNWMMSLRHRPARLRN